MIYMIQGTKRIIDITQLPARDLTGAVGYLQVRDASGAVILSRVTSDEDQGELIEPLETSRTMRFTFLPDDTRNTPPGVYRFDAVIVYGVDDEYNAHEADTFQIGERITRVEDFE